MGQTARPIWTNKGSKRVVPRYDLLNRLYYTAEYVRLRICPPMQRSGIALKQRKYECDSAANDSDSYIAKENAANLKQG